MSAAQPERVTALPIMGETAYYRTIVDTARIMGWHVHHQRPDRNGNPIMGHAGFPDFVFVHPRGHVLFVEVKSDRKGAHLTLEQRQWADALLSAGGRWFLFRVPSGLDELLALLVDLAQPT